MARQDIGCDAIGIIYLIHLETPLAHAKHYLGWTEDLAARMVARRSNKGSRLLAACNKAGINYYVTRVWAGTMTDERRLHNRKSSPRICPCCNPLLSEKAALKSIEIQTQLVGLHAYETKDLMRCAEIHQAWTKGSISGLGRAIELTREAMLPFLPRRATDGVRTP